MPSFDIVSELDQHELTNAIDQANREVTTRFDFKGSNAKFDLKDEVCSLQAEADFQLQQMLDVLRSKLTNRNIDIRCMDIAEPEIFAKEARQKVTFKQGLESELAKKIVKMIKDEKLKVQAAIQGDKIRVTGKKRDDLQSVIAHLRGVNLEMPLQYNNFRD
jgi:uncharacterized protein YajQ (UPF0234 family)